MVFALTAAAALLFDDQITRTASGKEHWLFVPFAYLVLAGSVYVVLKPAVSLWNLWISQDVQAVFDPTEAEPEVSAEEDI